MYIYKYIYRPIFNCICIYIYLNIDLITINT